MEINEKKLKEILTKQRESYQHYLGVLTENFESQVKLVAESVSGIQDQLIAIRDMVAKNTEDIEMIKMNVNVIKNDLKEKINRDEFAVLEKRIFFLEKKFQRA
jgi:molybdopterin converting factor small subunit